MDMANRMSLWERNYMFCGRGTITYKASYWDTWEILDKDLKVNGKPRGLIQNKNYSSCAMNIGKVDMLKTVNKIYHIDNSKNNILIHRVTYLYGM